MITDNNKSISIAYNELNLPHIVTKGNEQIEYLYTSKGMKIRRNVTGSVSKTTDYIGEAIYENGVIQFLKHEEGRTTLESGASSTVTL